MELLAYWRLIRRHLWLLAVFTLLSSASAAVFTLRQAPQYAATTTLFLNPAVAEPLLGYQNEASLQSLANTYAEFTRTHSFAERLAQESHIAVTPKILDNILSTKYVPDTQFFSITVNYPEPQVAQRLANTAASVLIDANTAWRQVERPPSSSTGSVDDPQNNAYAAELENARRTQLASYDAEIARRHAQLAELQSHAQSDERDQQVLQAQEQLRSLESARIDALESLVRMQADAAGTNAATAPTSIAVVVDPAQLPALPLPRGMLRAVAVTLAVSLVAGLGIIFLLEYLDESIKSPRMLEAVYGMATLGILMRPRPRWMQRHARSVLIAAEDAFALAESFRILQINVQATAFDTPLHSLLVTSALPNEGKTFVAANLAISLAQNGKSVIVVDADLRNPGLHTNFAVPSEPGLVNALSVQQDDPFFYLQNTEVENLWILPCGSLHTEGPQLLSSKQFVELTQQLTSLADVVIYDSPPLLGLSDAAMIAPHVDGVIQVVRAGKTSAELVLRGKAALERVHARIVGPVLNNVVLPEARAFAPYYQRITPTARQNEPTQEKHAEPVQHAFETSQQPYVNGRAHNNSILAPRNGDDT